MKITDPHKALRDFKTNRLVVHAEQKELQRQSRRITRRAEQRLESRKTTLAFKITAVENSIVDYKQRRAQITKPVLQTQYDRIIKALKAELKQLVEEKIKTEIEMENK
jgi:hypothetical protein